MILRVSIKFHSKNFLEFTNLFISKNEKISKIKNEFQILQLNGVLHGIAGWCQQPAPQSAQVVKIESGDQPGRPKFTTYETM